MSANILLVDDEQPVRMVVSRMLMRAGYSVRESESARTALEILKHEPIDVLVSDVRMPGMSGPELVASAWETLNPALPVVMITGYCPKEIPADILNRVQVVTKPFTADVLADNIEQARRKIIARGAG